MESVSAVITSPPYGDVATRRRSQEPASATRDVPEWVRKRRDASFHVDTYGRTPGQLGSLRGERYLAAMRRVYSECARVLRVGGVAAIITADYWRNHLRVDLSGKTAVLCREAGLVRVDWWRRDRSGQLTTWQRLRLRRGLGVVLEEDIQVFRRVA